MAVIQKSGVTIECVRGDIAHQPDVDAVVNAANAWLRPGAGVAGAIHRAAGPELARECDGLAPIACWRGGDFRWSPPAQPSCYPLPRAGLWR